MSRRDLFEGDGMIRITGRAKTSVESRRQEIHQACRPDAAELNFQSGTSTSDAACQFLSRYFAQSENQLVSLLNEQYRVEFIQASDYDELAWVAVRYLVEHLDEPLLGTFTPEVAMTSKMHERNQARLFIYNSDKSFFGAQPRDLIEFMLKLAERRVIGGEQARQAHPALYRWYEQVYEMYIDMLAIFLRCARANGWLAVTRKPSKKQTFAVRRGGRG